MKITMETDYAIRILYCLAKRDSKIDAKSISEEVGVTLRFSLKILRKLVQNHLVKSFKGVNGGYQLNCAPCDISFADVIVAIDGEIAINKCLADPTPCTRRKDKETCQFRKEFKRINDGIIKEFEAINLQKFL